jgi:hypothetical protein
VPAAFAAEAAFLVAAEGTGGIEFVVGIRPDDACSAGRAGTSVTTFRPGQGVHVSGRCLHWKG